MGWLKRVFGVAASGTSGFKWGIGPVGAGSSRPSSSAQLKIALLYVKSTTVDCIIMMQLAT